VEWNGKSESIEGIGEYELRQFYTHRSKFEFYQQDKQHLRQVDAYFMTNLTF
jgi:hypothetical protein